MGTGSGRELIDKCVFLKHCRDDAESLPEPEWYAAITNLAQTADGESIVHEISSPYPGYTREETQRKYVHAAQENKPVTCEYIKEHFCFDCGKDCRVKTPVTLVHTEKQKESVWEKPLPFDECTLPEFPVDALPKGIADYVTALAESTQTPVDMAASSALPIISVCIQGKAFFLLLFIICCLRDSVTERTKVIADGSNGVNSRQKMTIRAAEKTVLCI